MNALTKKKVSLWWKVNTHSFTFPPLYHKHRHVWVHIDVDTLGCRHCGVIHACSLGSRNCVPCMQETQQDSSVVCLYTGIVLSLTSNVYEHISVADYASGTSMLSRDPAARNAIVINEKVEVLRGLAWQAIETLLYSDKHNKARLHEQKRTDKKIESVFSAAVNTYTYALVQPNVVSCIEQALASVMDYREVYALDAKPPRRHWEYLVNNIVVLLMWIRIPKPYTLTGNTTRVSNLIMSLLYVSGKGIIHNDTVFLHQNTLITHFLPLELLLLPFLNIHSKIITEGENVIKRAINDALHVKHHVLQQDPPQLCLFSFNTPTCTCAESSTL